MARASLSSQVLEKEKRVTRILQGLVKISDPATATLLEEALVGMDDIALLCGNAIRKNRAAAVASKPPAAAAAAPAAAGEPTPRKTTTRARKAPAKAKED